MKERCLNHSNPAFKYYGARGIKICDRWLNSFEMFIIDMGRRPSPKHSIDRINNDGDYDPGNVKWATRIEQMNNRRGNVLLNTPSGLMTATQAARLYGGAASTLLSKVKKHAAFMRYADAASL